MAAKGQKGGRDEQADTEDFLYDMIIVGTYVVRLLKFTECMMPGVKPECKLYTLGHNDMSTQVQQL